MAPQATMEYVLPTLGNNYTSRKNGVFYAVLAEIL
jgi:hypothetical protein